MSGFKRSGTATRSPGGKFGRGFKRREFGGGTGGYAPFGAMPRKELHTTTCANCGERCEVPFRPNGSKPTFCQRCFRQQGSGPQEQARASRPSFGRPAFGERHERDAGNVENSAGIERKLEEMNMKLDRVIREIEALKEAAV